jgi:hypothetical protein
MNQLLEPEGRVSGKFNKVGIITCLIHGIELKLDNLKNF